VSPSVRQPFLFVLMLAVVGLVAAACGGDDTQQECLVAEDGTLVGAPCDVPAGVTAELTPTPQPPTNGGGNGAGAGFVAFRGAGCAGCHTIDGTAAAGVAGPNLTNVAAKGKEFILKSIIEPSADVAAGFPDGIMPQNFGTALSEEEREAIVNFLGDM
jgi:mono/diheme cytochrome c family protein